jgi:hypothetical protein
MHNLKSVEVKDIEDESDGYGRVYYSQKIFLVSENGSQLEICMFSDNKGSLYNREAVFEESKANIG